MNKTYLSILLLIIGLTLNFLGLIKTVKEGIIVYSGGEPYMFSVGIMMWAAGAFMLWIGGILFGLPPDKKISAEGWDKNLIRLAKARDKEDMEYKMICIRCDKEVSKSSIPYCDNCFSELDKQWRNVVKVIKSKRGGK